MRIWLSAISKTCWGIYLVLTSIYCLLAFLPYTYVALIKEPPYEWVPWFAHHQGILWLATLGLIVAVGPHRTKRRLQMYGALAIVGVYLVARPFLPSLQDNWSAYWWSVAALVPLTLVAGMDVRQLWRAASNKDETRSLLPYSVGVVAAVLAAVTYAAAAQLQGYVANRPLKFDWGRVEITGWSLISHILVAIIVLSGLNLVRIASTKTRRPASTNLAAIGALIFLLFWTLLFRFLSSALSFEGWAAHLYAASLAAALTLWLMSLVLSWMKASVRPGPRTSFLAPAILLALFVFALSLPTLISGSDWNGVLQASFALMFWAAVSACIFRWWPRRAQYSVAVIFATVLVAGFAYKALQATEIFWGKPLGSTDDDVSHAMENYASQDASFQLTHYFLGNGRGEACADLCRILRENTNIRDAEVKSDLWLVSPLVPSPGPHPNIFIFVIDSLRSDYLGAYNSKVDFTPNLDAFARDNVVVHNVYTQYAGTSLSEPAIWAGAMLLHAHYMQPFSRVNSLEKLARADGYRMVVSYDEILRQLLSSSDDLVKLDTDKKLWNQLEVCSTIRQFEPLLGGDLGNSRPVLFYAQPKNVHQFARNDLPMVAADHWQSRPGFYDRIAHEVHQVDSCLGDFFSFLRARGMYDDSIIIVTSDHGDATGDFGRYSHSLSIYPEVMRVPLLVHLPARMRRAVVYDDNHLSALTDITPSLYYLLGHRPVRSHAFFGHPLFVETQEELNRNQRNELFLASDERAVYGWLTENGRFLYTTYDSPARSFLFDLGRDPNAEHNILTDPLKKQYDKRIIDELHGLADFYGYRTGVGSLLAAAK